MVIVLIRQLYHRVRHACRAYTSVDSVEPPEPRSWWISPEAFPALQFYQEDLEMVPGLRVPVARIGHLMALKILARNDRDRPQDLDDLRALLLETEPATLHR